MGYAAVLSLDDRKVRTTGGDVASLLADDLYAVLGARRALRPSRPTAGTFWHLAGTWHTNDQVLCVATAEQVTAAEQVVGAATLAETVARACGFDAVDAPDWVGQPRPVDAGVVGAATREAARTGRSPAEIIWGADRTTGRSLRSVWWLYLDAIDDHTDLTDLAAGVVAVLDRRFDGTVPVGVHGNACNRAGWLTAPGPVALVWSGNRLCRPDDLTPPEVAKLTAGPPPGTTTGREP